MKTNIFFLISFFLSISSCAMEQSKSQSMPELTNKSPRDLITSPRKFSLKIFVNDSSQSSLTDPFVAVRKKSLDELKHITRIKYIFDANMKEEGTGQTLLHYCVFNKDEVMIKFLMLEKKADPLIINNAGKSALDSAREYEFARIETVINECLINNLYADAQNSLKAKYSECHA